MSTNDVDILWKQWFFYPKRQLSWELILRVQHGSERENLKDRALSTYLFRYLLYVHRAYLSPTSLVFPLLFFYFFSLLPKTLLRLPLLEISSLWVCLETCLFFSCITFNVFFFTTKWRSNKWIRWASPSSDKQTSCHRIYFCHFCYQYFVFKIIIAHNRTPASNNC